MFHAPALVRDGNLGELRRLFDRAREARCNGVRVFGSWHFIGGGLAPYSVADPAWFEWMEVVIDEATKRRLFVECSYFCDAQVLVPHHADRTRLFRAFAEWVFSRSTLLVTAANEARKNGWSEADDSMLLELIKWFKLINTMTPLGASDPLDAGAEGTGATDYNARQRRIANAGVDFLLVHPHRKPRFAWVDHLYGAAQTPGAVGFPGRCWIQEPMGGASVDQSGRRDSSVVAHVAAACVGAMVGAYTYMHRQMEDDVCPGLLESAVAADIPGSPDYRFINATLHGSPVERFTEFDKCRTLTNGVDGWVVAYGPREGVIQYAGGWRETWRRTWRDATGICRLLRVER